MFCDKTSTYYWCSLYMYMSDFMNCSYVNLYHILKEYKVLIQRSNNHQIQSSYLTVDVVNILCTYYVSLLNFAVNGEH